jgi:hypothetical protein
MAKVNKVEKRIRDVEGFKVRIRHENGRDLRADKKGLPQYPYERKAKKNKTVADWKGDRFSNAFPGYGVDVLDANGVPVKGNTLLATVRKSYNSD